MRREALDWLASAEEDLGHSRRSLEMKDFAWACFSAQQAAEKAFKAIILGIKRKRPERTHDLTELYAAIGDLRPPLNRAAITELSHYYITARYPNAGYRRPSRALGLAQGKKAIGTAESVVQYAKHVVAEES